MTNEELALRIHNGEEMLKETLWLNIERFVAFHARRVVHALQGFGGVELGDFISSGYIAMEYALKTYGAEKPSFLNWFMYYLRTAFAQTAGYRTKRQCNDPLQSYVSLHTPIGDDEDLTLEDLQADPESFVPFEEAEERIDRERLRKVLDEMLEELPQQQKTTLQCRYYLGQTLEQIASANGVSKTRIEQIEDIALRNMRKAEKLARLEKFLDYKTPFFLQVTPSEFQRTHTSAVEKIVLLRERMMKGRKNYDDQRNTEPLSRPQC